MPLAITRTFVFIMLMSLLATSGCWQKMREMPRYEPYESNAFFRDSLSMRPIPEGTVNRSGIRFGGPPPLFAQTPPYTAVADTAGGQVAEQFVLPFPVNQRLLKRGQQQFNIYCAPCHSRLGNGRGMIVQRGLRPPPSFHTERLREAPLAHFFNVITNGYGAMYSYADRVNRADRWAIAAYIRALQRSQYATLDDVPPATRRELEGSQP